MYCAIHVMDDTLMHNVLKSWLRARRRKEWRRRVKVITRNYVLYFKGN